MPPLRAPCRAALAALLAPALLAAQGGVRVERRGPAHLSAAAGSQATLAFRVSTSSAVPVDAVPEPGLPPGWRLVAPEAVLHLSAGGAETHLLAFAVPARAAAGAYVVRYAVRAGGARAMDSVVVDVAARHRVGARAGDAPRFAAADAGYSAAFEVRNDGNAPERVALSVRGDHGLGARLDAAELVLAAGEARTVRARVGGAGARAAAFTHVLTLTARALDDTASASAASRVEVVPAAAAAGPRFRSVPAALRLRAVDAPGGAAVVPALTAAGTVPGTGARLDLQLQGEDSRPGIPGESSVYRVGISAASWGVELGDQVFSLTPLTERGSFAFGGGGRVEGRWASAAAFAARQRRGPGGGREAGGTLGLGPAWMRAAASWLRRTGPDSGTVRSVGLRLLPFASASAFVEAARSEGGGARTAGVEYASRGLTLSARHLDADPGFAGRDRGAREDGASVRVGAGRGPRAEVRAYRRSEGTAFVAPAAGLSSTREKAEAAVGWGQAVTLRAAAEHRVGTLFGGAYDRRARSLSAQATLRGGGLWLRPGLEVGTAADLLSGADDEFRRGSLEAGMRTRGGSGVWIGLRGQEGRGAEPFTPFQGWSGTLDAVLSVAGATTLHLSAFATRQPDGDPSGLVDLSVSQGLPLGHRVVARTRMGVGALGPAPARPASTVDYVVPLALPVLPAAPRGTASGRVYDAETGRGMAGLPVRVGGRVALTDAGGRWRVSGLGDGAYAVEPDRIAAGVGRVAAPSEHDTVRVHGGRARPVQTPLVRGGSLAGTVRGSARGVALVLAGPSGTLRREVDAAGAFRFADLPPGRWTLSADAATLPAHTRVRGLPAQVELAPGQATRLEADVEEVERPLRIVAEAEVALAAPPSPTLGARPRSGVARSVQRAAAAPAPQAVEYDELVGTYTVQPGDAGLEAIAWLVYVRGDLWPRLWLANRDRVPDPRRPPPGTELKIPAPGPLTPAERAVLEAAGRTPR